MMARLEIISVSLSFFKTQSEYAKIFLLKSQSAVLDYFVYFSNFASSIHNLIKWNLL